MIKITTYSKKFHQDTVNLILEIYEKELKFTGYNRPDLQNIEKNYLKNDKSNFWIALDNNEVIGTIGILKKHTDLAYIKRLTVKKKYRGQGIGNKLLQTAISFAQKQNFKTLYAGTVKENPAAIEFYKKQNFTINKTAPDDITASSNSICLELKL